MMKVVFGVFVLFALFSLSNGQFLEQQKGSFVSIDQIMAHLDALQAIADANGGNRAAQNPGYNASVDYVTSILADNTNYTVTVQPFNFDITDEVSAPTFGQVSPTPVNYARYIDFLLMSYTGSGDVQAPISFASNGCEPGFYNSLNSGDIAIVARGECDFSMKVDNAVLAGAAGVLIYNYPGEGVFSGTLGSTKSIPVFGISYDLGRSFVDNSVTPTLSMTADMSVVTVYTSNVIADTTTGNENAVIVVGSHLDSVPAGPGINDNGSGSATNLELATQLFASNITLTNKVRFCWWGAEELGLLGSEYYVEQAIASGEINNIALNLNFDMLGSPNYFRGVYDGAGAASSIRTGSINIENLLTNFFDFEGLPWDLTEFNGRSDYGPFIANGIPAGGLFTGAEVIKPDDWRKQYGGLASTAFDPCYHGGCDDIYNINEEVLSSNAKAAYYATTTLAQQSLLENWLQTSHQSSSTLPKPRGNHFKPPASRIFTKQ